MTAARIPHPDLPVDALDKPSLIDVLTLERLEHDIFRGWSPAKRLTRVFGGQVAAQAIRAAQETVDDDGLHLHSLHAYFLRGGDWRQPILFRVDRIRDGRSFVTRRVVAIQYGEAIFHLDASFQRDEEGYEFQVGSTEAVDLPTFAPDDVPPDSFAGLVDSRQIDNNDIPTGERPARWIWFRIPGIDPADRGLTSAALVYASDHGPVGSTKRPHLGEPGIDRTMSASLDHLVWFHRSTDLSQWHFYDLRPASSHGARGLAHGSIYRQDGTLVASVVQEGLVRPWRDR
jgi:acyl-CoA thioesterase II